MKLKLVSLLLISLCLSPVVNADSSSTYPVAKVDYSADMSFTAGKVKMNGKVNATKDKERREVNFGGMDSVIIVRRDKKKAFILMPKMKMYMESEEGYRQMFDPTFSGAQFSLKDTGKKEIIAGQATSKFQITAKQKDGSTMTGFMWLTKDNIIMRAEGKGRAPAQMSGGKPGGSEEVNYTMELSNVKLHPQAVTLFEVPQDYRAMPTMPNGAGSVPPETNAVPETPAAAAKKKPRAAKKAPAQ